MAYNGRDSSAILPVTAGLREASGGEVERYLSMEAENEARDRAAGLREAIGEALKYPLRPEVREILRAALAASQPEET